MREGTKTDVGDGPALAAWKLPLIVAAIATSIVGGFYLGGPGAGMAVGALAAASLLVMAARNPPRGPIVPAAARDRRARLLVVATEPLEDAAAVRAAINLAASRDGDMGAPEILVLAPVRHRFLDRWASDLDRGHHEAQSTLVLSLASLAAAGLDASARVGDEDAVQAVEDQLRSFAAGAVILVGGASQRSRRAVAAELQARLSIPFTHLRPGDARGSTPRPGSALPRKLLEGVAAEHRAR